MFCFKFLSSKHHHCLQKGREHVLFISCWALNKNVDI